MNLSKHERALIHAIAEGDPTLNPGEAEMLRDILERDAEPAPQGPQPSDAEKPPWVGPPKDTDPGEFASEYQQVPPGWTLDEYGRPVRPAEPQGSTGATGPDVGSYFVYCDGSMEYYDDAATAQREAESALEDFRNYACDGWQEEADNIRWGQVLGWVHSTDPRPATQDDLVADEVTEIVEKSIRSAALNAPSPGLTPAMPSDPVMVPRRDLENWREFAWRAVDAGVDIEGFDPASHVVVKAMDALLNPAAKGATEDAK